ncbi:MAG TPA: response regulator, partial [Geminicoccaceae bacterium]|nr:response regulator [Geminicoccaceae bacterium]
MRSSVPAPVPVGGMSAGATAATGGVAVRVLVVEPEADGERASTRALARPAGGFEVCRAGSLAAAERALGADDGFEVVVLDVALPDSWPADTCGRIAAAALAPGLPVVVVSRVADAAVVRAARAAGMEAYLDGRRAAPEDIQRVVRCAAERRRALLAAGGAALLWPWR